MACRFKSGSGYQYILRMEDDNIKKFDDEIDLTDLFFALWKRKILISLITSVAAIFSVYYALSLANIYTSKALLAPSASEDSLSSKLGGYSSLAGLAGFTIPSQTGRKATEAIERIKSYEDAGAHIIFPESMKDEKEFEKVRKELSCYLLANMTEFGKSKLFNYKELEKFGYNIVIYPVTTQRLAMKNVEDGLRDIYANGHQNNIIDKMQTRKRLYELVDYEKYNSLDEKIYNFSTKGHE